MLFVLFVYVSSISATWFIKVKGLVYFLITTIIFCNDLNFCTSNVRGMRQSTKGRQQFAYFLRQAFDIVLVQETVL